MTDAGFNTDPLNSEWISIAASTDLNEPKSQSFSLPPLLPPPRQSINENERILQELERRMEKLKKQRPNASMLPLDVQDQLVLEDKQILKTKIEAEVEPLLETTELGSPPNEMCDPSSHPRYTALFAAKPKPKTTEEEESEGSEGSEEAEEDAGLYDKMD